MLKITAIGNLTHDVELKMNENTGKPYAILRIASDRRYKDMRLRSPGWNSWGSLSVCCIRIRPIWICLQEQLPAVRKKDFDADSLCAGIATFSGTVSSVPSAGITGL